MQRHLPHITKGEIKKAVKEIREQFNSWQEMIEHKCLVEDISVENAHARVGNNYIVYADLEEGIQNHPLAKLEVYHVYFVEGGVENAARVAVSTTHFNRYSEESIARAFNRLATGCYDQIIETQLESALAACTS